jgi:hypothetical protein
MYGLQILKLVFASGTRTGKHAAPAYQLTQRYILRTEHTTSSLCEGAPISIDKVARRGTTCLSGAFVFCRSKTPKLQLTILVYAIFQSIECSTQLQTSCFCVYRVDQACLPFRSRVFTTLSGCSISVRTRQFQFPSLLATGHVLSASYYASNR